MRFTNEEPNHLEDLAAGLRKEYANADPFPSIYLDDFFEAECLYQVLREFPNLSKEISYKDRKYEVKKFASKGEASFGKSTLQFLHYLNSEPFLYFLSALTGIKELIPDPYLVGGGIHEILPGGRLGIHADFNIHPITGLDRRLNVLIYLNENWKEEYGGHFELWATDQSRCVKRILPVFNRMAIFSTTSNSFHGHPEPLSCPADLSRRSIALYYYTNGRPEEERNEAHSTLFIGQKKSMRTKVRETVRVWAPSLLKWRT